MRRRIIDQGALASDLAGLPGLTTKELLTRWKALYRNTPPARISRQLLLRAIAHRMQEIALGGVKPTVRRILDKAAVDVAAGREIAAPAPAFKPGTRLLREWRGHTHEVILLEDGVLYDGTHFRSLSEVARTITGARWSGPRFFGLKGREGNHAAA